MLFLTGMAHAVYVAEILSHNAMYCMYCMPTFVRKTEFADSTVNFKHKRAQCYIFKFITKHLSIMWLRWKKI